MQINQHSPIQLPRVDGQTVSDIRSPSCTSSTQKPIPQPTGNCSSQPCLPDTQIAQRAVTSIDSAIRTGVGKTDDKVDQQQCIDAIQAVSDNNNRIIKSLLVGIYTKDIQAVKMLVKPGLTRGESSDVLESRGINLDDFFRLGILSQRHFSDFVEFAIRCSGFEIAQFLIDKGFIFDKKYICGGRLFSDVLFHKNVHGIAFCLKHGADLKKPVFIHQLPIDLLLSNYAGSGRNVDSLNFKALKVMIDYGQDFNVEDLGPYSIPNILPLFKRLLWYTDKFDSFADFLITSVNRSELLVIAKQFNIAVEDGLFIDERLVALEVNKIKTIRRWCGNKMSLKNISFEAVMGRLLKSECPLKALEETKLLSIVPELAECWNVFQPSDFAK